MLDKDANGSLVLISAPSGGGKNTVIRELLKRFKKSTQLVTTTTRAPRKGEKDGVAYHFISREEFETKIANGEFVEYNEYAGNLYGTQWKHLNELLKTNDLVFSQAEVNGKKNLDKAGVPHVSIFLLPENLGILERRIRNRGDVTEEIIKKRLTIAEGEIAQAGIYDLQVVNKDRKIRETVEEIALYLERNVLSQ